MRLEPTISTLTAICSIQRAKQDSDGYMMRKYITLNVCKSEISFTKLYEFIRHIRFCGRVPWLYQYWPGGFMSFVVLCPGTPKGSTCSGSGFKASHSTDWEKPGIEPATPRLKDIDLSPTPRQLFGHAKYIHSASIAKQS